MKCALVPCVILRCLSLSKFFNSESSLNEPQIVDLFFIFIASLFITEHESMSGMLRYIKLHVRWIFIFC